VKGFDGTETADHGSIVDRRDTYVADRVTVFDDRRRCAHFGQCTDRLPAVFRAENRTVRRPQPRSAATPWFRRCTTSRSKAARPNQ
jgi:uncharacterized Fe-S cluster protein YjdI